jgi:transcriptional repressor NrdR
MPLVVIKSDDKRETFDRNKLREGIERACEKRPISSEAIEKMVSEIENRLQEDYLLEVTSKTIGEMTLQKLRSIDEVAYVRFASVYKQFADVDAFLMELKKLKKHQSKSHVIGNLNQPQIAKNLNGSSQSATAA